MATYSAKSRAPLIPLSDPEQANNGEILVIRKDTSTQLLIAIQDGNGDMQYIDLVRAVTDGLIELVKDARQYKIDTDKPLQTREHLWFKVTEFDNEQGTIVPIDEYPAGVEPDFL